MALIFKICGLKDMEAVDAALDVGADMIGFVFFAPSPRDVSPADAARLVARARGRAEIVALTVDADDALFDAITSALRPDWLQLHGRESRDRVSALKHRFGVPVLKVLGVSTAGDVDRAGHYAGVADRLLFDAKPPKQATRPGGLGTRFDWSLLKALDPAVPFMLSGGLDADNVGEAVRQTRAIGLDVSSGVERAPGVKDPVKIREFAEAVRRADAARSAARRSA